MDPAVPEEHVWPGRVRVAREIVWLTCTELAVVVAVVLLMQLWRAHPRIPLFYNAPDVALNAGQIKTILFRGWYLDNPKLGFPTGQNSRDFPLGDGWHLLFFHLFSLGSRDWALAMNVFYLGSFLLVGAATYVAMRVLNVAPSIAAGAGVITTLAPYHFERNEMHLFLAEYSAVPLVVMLAVVQLSPRPWLRLARGAAKSWLSLAAIAIAIWAAGTGTYYAIFSALVLATTALLASVVRREREPVLSGLLLAGVIVLGLGVQLVPTFRYDAQHGRNHSFDRTFTESEIYSLRPALLVMPIPQHRIHALGSPARKYAQERFPSEPQALGLVATLGLLGLLAVALSPILGGRGLRDPIDRGLALVALTATTFGITAGASMVLGLFGFTEIRAWARLSIFLAVVGVAAAARALDRIITGRRIAPVAVLVIVVLITTFAVLDQTSPADTPRYGAVTASFDAERTFTANIERVFGRDAAVLQLPYVPYPEARPPGRMVDYAQMHGWLHSDTLRWSYGAVKGRPTWQDGQLSLSLHDQLIRARAAGFTAVWVDRFGYTDDGATIEQQLTRCLGEPVLIETDNRRVVHDLRAPLTC